MWPVATDVVAWSLSLCDWQPWVLQSVWIDCGATQDVLHGSTDPCTWRGNFDGNKPVVFYGPIAPPVPNAPSSECPRVSIAACRLAAGSVRISGWALCCCSSAIAGIAIRANFKIYLLRKFCLNRIEFFLQYTGDTDAKNDGPEFWNSNYLIFENFLKFSKRRRAVPLRPSWTIMVAAKLDQSRVLVTKSRQNRLTLKGRSACHRHTHTHRQTNSAENNGPSGLQMCRPKTSP